MAKEIERKWLAVIDGSLNPTRTRIIESAYLSAADPEVRVARYRGMPGSYQITAKKGAGIAREEVVVDVEDGEGLILFGMAEHTVSKVRDDVAIPVSDDRRYRTEAYTHPWEIDTYLGRYAGIVVAEIELPSRYVRLPDQPSGLRLLKEVTDDPNWKNKALAMATDAEARERVQEYLRELDETGAKCPEKGASQVATVEDIFQ